MNIHASYFALSPAFNPFYLLDKWLNPSRHRRTVSLHGHALVTGWTERAQRAMQQRSSPLVVEMQLYFSCVVKKRVIFHDHAKLDLVDVSEWLRVGFRPVQSASCDPDEFARNYPVQRPFDSCAAAKMNPRWLLIDYKNGSFVGEFGL